MLSAVLLGLLVANAAAASGPVRDALACGTAIGAVEHASRTPAGLLAAIGVVESGRADPVTRRVAAWPWAVDVAGQGMVYETKQAAIDAVRTAQAAGIRSIDVGCMQINLQQHPAAFETLDDAFDPDLNVRYAAAFLGQLFRRLGDWPQAVGSYHSSTPGLSDAYRTRVLAAWGGAAPATFTAPAPACPAASGPDTRPGGVLQAVLAEAAADQARWRRLGWTPPPPRQARSGQAAPCQPGGERARLVRQVAAQSVRLALY